jgi:hypothetical protein
VNVEPPGLSAVRSQVAAIEQAFAALDHPSSAGGFAAVLSAVSGGQSAVTGAQDLASGAWGAGGPGLSGSSVAGPWEPGAAGVGGPSGEGGPLGGWLGSGITGEAVVADAERYLGVPYRWGGTSPQTGFDCSGLVQRVFADLGVALPRTSEEQATVGVAVPSLAAAEPGDLVFFEPGPSGPGHVGIYVGGGMMIDAPHTGTVVRIEPVGNPYEIRRVLPPASSEPVPGLGAATPSPEAEAGAMASAPAEEAMAGTASGAPGVPPQLAPLFAKAASRYGLPPALLPAVAEVESGFDPGAVSPAGAEGLMQLMPSVAASLGVDPFDPAQAISGAARILASDLQRFGGSLPLALASYNAGPGAVAAYGGIPPYRQTQDYVAKVLSTMERLA